MLAGQDPGLREDLQAQRARQVLHAAGGVTPAS